MREFGQWRFACDVESTRAAYQRAPSGWAGLCGCEGCRNFVAARDRVFPPEFIDFLHSVGIDPSKEAEVYHLGEAGPDNQPCGGWFHFIGELIHTGDFAPVDYGQGFSALLTRGGGPSLPSLEGQHLVQVEFWTHSVPWRLSGPQRHQS